MRVVSFALPLPLRPVRSFRCPLLVPADQIQQREEIDPDDVDKVPVEAEVLHKCDVARGVSPGPGAEDHECQNPDADDHVQRVHAGHEEVEREVNLGVPRHVQGSGLSSYSVNFGIGVRIEKRLQAVVKAGNVVLLDLLPVLDGLDAQETQAENEGETQAKHQAAPAPRLGAPHAHGHGEAG